MSQQQTILRVQTNIPDTTISGKTQYDFLDLYSDIPIKISKSFAELQDIATKNSDYSIGLSLPGSKKNNRFFENFFNVDTVSLFFNASKRVECEVLLNDQAYFRGYLRLNKVSVLNSLVEYDVTLYSTVGNLFGNIGNNLLKDLNYNDSDYFFNHVFNNTVVGNSFRNTNFSIDGEKPYPYIYPVVHNGYEYSGTTVTFSGATSGSTRFYTSTNSSGGTLNSYISQAAAWADGVQEYHINSPAQGLINNQLKPALNIWSLIKLIFKTYDYTIKSDFMNTPWIKTLYMYGYFSSEATKFGYKITNIQELPLEGVEIITYLDTSNSTLNTIVCKLGTGIPCFSLDDITYTLVYTSSTVNGTIVAGTSGNTTSTISGYVQTTSQDVTVANSNTLKYFPKPIGAAAIFEDGNFVDFGLVIDQNIKQIDVLSSIAKKFNLVFIPDPDVPNQLIIEPFDFYMGTGNIYDWTPKLSYDKGWSVEPALNFIESTLLFTDKEDQDEGNREFKARNNRIYGQNNVYNPTDFKSQNKTIDTIFSPELIRKWDKDGVDNISLPLGINYAASSSENVSGTTNSVTWSYKGVKTQPKLMYWLGAFNPFLNEVNESYPNRAYSTYSVYLTNSSASAYSQSNTIPAISHTIPLGLEDNRKINNDSLSILFNSELPTNIGVQTFNVYTENDVYNKFYKNRITNLYNPNTRFLSGYFDLKYSDVQNLNGNDLIKINEQLFLINKLNDYNLTNRELTNVELVQYNTTFQTYTDRYFIYTYYDTDTCYKFKTDFTNPNLLDSNFGWSVYFDYQLGSISGTTATSFTSSFLDIQDGVPKYVGYTMIEITKEEYESTSCRDWTCDTLHNYIYSLPNGPFDFSMPTFWTNFDATYTGVNLFEDAANFVTFTEPGGILSGSSIYHGEIFGGICGTPTPTPTPTSTPTPTPTPTGPTPTPTVTPTSTPTPTINPLEQGRYMGVTTNTEVLLSSDFGATWSINKSGNFNDISISENGQYLIICGDGANLWTSNDYGATWTNRLVSVTNWKTCTVSSTGQYMAAAAWTVGINSSQYYISTDYGVNWTLKTAGFPAPYWTGIAIPENGFTQYASAYGIWSQAGNALWSLTGSTSSLQQLYAYVFSIYTDINISKTGQYIIAARRSQSTQPNIVFSSNSGTTFTEYGPILGTPDVYYPYVQPKVSMSENAQYQLLSSFAGQLYLSTNTGSTFTAITGITTDIIDNAMSGNGNYMIATFQTGIYISSNNGSTWSTVRPFGYSFFRAAAINR